MGYLLNLIYAGLLTASAPWLLWRSIRWGKNRRGWPQKLGGWTPTLVNAHAIDSDRPQAQSRRIWFHAVSVGEVNLLKPLIERWQRACPHDQLLISTTTETGYDLAKRRYPQHQVGFFPLDFTWAVNRSLKRIDPDLIVLAELEIWPNFLAIASRRKTPIAVVNGRLSENSFRGYRRLGRFIRPAFKALSWVGVQNKTYAHRFIDLGCSDDKVTITGNIKFDGVQTDRNNPQSSDLRRLTRWSDKEFVFLAGSTQAEEDLLAAEVYQSLKTRHQRLRLILAPRHPERCTELITAIRSMDLSIRRRSELSAAESGLQDDEILLIDVIGELGAWWGIADAAYVGGSMGARQGQNMIEPAAYGIPVSFGPCTKNFQEVVTELLSQAAATVVRSQPEMLEFVERAIADQAWAQTCGREAQTVVQRHQGAADRTLENLLQLINSATGKAGSDVPYAA